MNQIPVTTNQKLLQVGIKRTQPNRSGISVQEITEVVKKRIPKAKVHLVKKPKDKFTMYPNEMLDGVCEYLNPYQNIILIQLYRLTVGFQSNPKVITLKALALKSNVALSTVKREIANLIDFGLVISQGNYTQNGKKNASSLGVCYVDENDLKYIAFINNVPFRKDRTYYSLETKIQAEEGFPQNPSQTTEGFPQTLSTKTDESLQEPLRGSSRPSQGFQQTPSGVPTDPLLVLKESTNKEERKEERKEEKIFSPPSESKVQMSNNREARVTVSGDSGKDMVTGTVMDVVYEPPQSNSKLITDILSGEPMPSHSGVFNPTEIVARIYGLCKQHGVPIIENRIQDQNQIMLRHGEFVSGMYSPEILFSTIYKLHYIKEFYKTYHSDETKNLYDTSQLIKLMGVPLNLKSSMNGWVDTILTFFEIVKPIVEKIQAKERRKQERLDEEKRKEDDMKAQIREARIVRVRRENRKRVEEGLPEVTYNGDGYKTYEEGLEKETMPEFANATGSEWEAIKGHLVRDKEYFRDGCPGVNSEALYFMASKFDEKYPKPDPSKMKASRVDFLSMMSVFMGVKEKPKKQTPPEPVEIQNPPEESQKPLESDEKFSSLKKIVDEDGIDICAALNLLKQIDY